MAGRYASALFGLAREQGALDKAAGDLKTFAGLMQSSPDLTRLVKSPAFTAENQVKGLTPVLARAGIDGLAERFIKLVASKRRLFAIERMIEDFGRLLDHDRGVVRAEVTVAEPLNDRRREELRQALQEASGGNVVEIAVKVDPAIIGGLVVKLGSRMVDGSLKTKLNTIRTRMKEAG